MDIPSINSIASAGISVSDRAYNTAITPQPTKAVAPVDAGDAVQATAATQTASKEQITKAVDSINKTIQASAQNIEFSVDHDAHKVIVKVVDQQTKEVIRQIPNEEVLEIAKSLDKLQGIIIKQTA